MEKRLCVLVGLGHEPVLRQRGVQIDHVRHDGRADDPDREQRALAAPELGIDGVLGHRVVVRVGEGQLDDVAGADHAHQHGDHSLECAESEPLQAEDQERGDSRDDRRGKEPAAEQQMEADCGAEELGQVGGHRDQLRLRPEEEGGLSGEPLPADLGQVAAGGDPKLGRQCLDQGGEQIGDDDHPDEAIAVAGPAGDIRREVAGIDIRDAGDEGRPEEGEDAKARAVDGLVDRAEAFRQLGPGSDHSSNLAGPKTPVESLGSSADEAQIRQVAVALVELEAVADEELVGDREADVADGQVVDEPPVRTVEQGCDVQRAGVSEGHRADEVMHRQAGVDDRVHEQDVAAFDLGVQILEEANPAVVLAVAGELDEVEMVVDRDRT